ncbi:hypothetical protein CDAR_78341 [Caerostris darwini]|uniref:Uncharacterized protein n=1 Tax=Caerostris darwini TaxID=1538125 RepID=A0AAV4SBY5_9ARAC|nr:hypothetical protein CDAR_78341 [Caerostris darwini]
MGHPIVWHITPEKWKEKVLTHSLAQHPLFRHGVQFHQDGWHAHQENHQVRHAEVDEEEVGGVPELLGAPHHRRHQDVARRAQRQDDGAHGRRRDPDVGGQLGGGRGPDPRPHLRTEVGQQVGEVLGGRPQVAVLRGRVIAVDHLGEDRYSGVFSSLETIDVLERSQME